MRREKRLTEAAKIVAWLAAGTALAGCAPSWYRSDADRQVLSIVREQQGKTVGYSAPIDVAVDEPLKPSKKSYDPLPTTQLPEALHDVIFTSPPPARGRRLGPEFLAPTPPSEQSAEPLASNSAVDRTRSFVREPYRLGPDASLASDRRFGLFESIAYAVENSREYQSQMETLYVEALDVTLERHLFSPRPFANVRGEFEGGQGNVNYRAATIVTGEAGVRQQLPLGGQIVASGLVRFVDALNDASENGETATLALTGSIPFLRGAGFVNLEPLIQSERDVVYAVRAFETYRRSFAVQIAAEYFNLLTAQLQVRNRYLLYVSSVGLVTRSQAYFDAGRITSLELQRSQTQLLRAEDQVNNALQSYENAVDRFKLLIGMPVDESLQVAAVEVDVPVPALDAVAAANLARTFRLDLQTTRDRVEDARRRVKVRENALLPNLDLTFGADIGNDGIGRARDIDADSIGYNAGLRLDLPLDRVAERNQYRVSLIALETARRNAEQQNDQVAVDVRRAIRGIRSAITSLELQRRGIEIARERLDAANMFLDTGKSTNTRDIVEAQTELLSAQDAFNSARAALQIAILNYLRDAGVLRLDASTGELGRAMDRPTRTPAPPNVRTRPVQLPAGAVRASGDVSVPTS